MTDDKRSIELEIEVPGTPEEVWAAIATGPGITSWYVPHTVEEREGGAMTASFGEGPEMQISGRVAAWEPPHRVMFDGGDGVDGLAFEWQIEAKDSSSCIVRLVNSGFGSGDPWDDQYDAMHEGWKIFLANLALHCEHFLGQAARASLPMTMLDGSTDSYWNELTDRLGLPQTLDTGELVEITAPDGSTLVARVASASARRYALMLVEEPVRGSAFIAVESHGGGMVGVSMWTYLYGDDGAAFSEGNEPGWQAMLAEL